MTQKAITAIGLVFVFFSSITALAQISIQPENRCSAYDRDDYYYPQSVELRIIEQQGGIFSPYNNQSFSDRSETDIEHIVSLSEAHDSGLCAASVAARSQFAQDLDNLTLASPELNRGSKGARDLAEWMSPQNVCWYVQTVVHVKNKYGLSMDQREAQTAVNVLASCSSNIECEQAGSLEEALSCYANVEVVMTTSGEADTTDSANEEIVIDSNSCFPHGTAYITGQMNIREEATTSSSIVETVYSGSFTVTGSEQASDYCWIRLENGWVADTIYVDGTAPNSAPASQPSAPVEQPSAPVQQPSAPVEQPSAPVEQPSAPVEQPSAPVQQPAPVNALAAYDDNGNGRITCAEARGHGIAPVSAGHPAYPYMDDRDGDGIVCE